MIMSVGGHNPTKIARRWPDSPRSIHMTMLSATEPIDAIYTWELVIPQSLSLVNILWFVSFLSQICATDKQFIHSILAFACVLR